MLKTEKVTVVFAHLGLECPAASAVDVLKPAGKAPSMQDLIELHIPLQAGSDVRAEVEANICPGITDHEEMIDDSDDEKPGSVKITVTRKQWGTYLLLLQAEGVSGSVLRMEGARLKGKPEVSVYKGVPPVLQITFRGMLTDGAGVTSDEIRRRWVHSQLLLTLAEQQQSITDEDEADMDRAAGISDPPAAAGPAALAPAVGAVSGSTRIGPRPDALPEHDFTSEFTKRTAEEMEKICPGFKWAAIQARQRAKPGAPMVLGWSELTAAASIKGDVAGMKEIRSRVEAGA